MTGTTFRAWAAPLLLACALPVAAAPPAPVADYMATAKFQLFHCGLQSKIAARHDPGPEKDGALKELQSCRVDAVAKLKPFHRKAIIAAKTATATKMLKDMQDVVVEMLGELTPRTGDSPDSHDARIGAHEALFDVMRARVAAEY